MNKFIVIFKCDSDMIMGTVHAETIYLVINNIQSLIEEIIIDVLPEYKHILKPENLVSIQLIENMITKKQENPDNVIPFPPQH